MSTPKYKISRRWTRAGVPPTPLVATHVPTGQPKEWTKAEQVEKLKGYMLVPPEYWQFIRNGEHVRYYTKEAGFRPGGFVAINPVEEQSDDSPEVKKFIRFKSDLFSKGFNWQVSYADIDQMYVKMSAVQLFQDEYFKAAMEKISKNFQILDEKIDNIAETLRKLKHKSSRD